VRPGGERVGLAVYASQGRTMSLFMGAPKLLCPPGLKQPEGQLYAQDNATLSLVAWQHNQQHLDNLRRKGLRPRLKNNRSSC
jgi:hypothetical protein